MSINIDKILLELELLPNFKEQIPLQGVEGIDDPNYGTGRSIDLNHSEEEFVVPLFKELEYTNQVIKDLNMFRTRIMRMYSKTCYSYHKDRTKRLHIPLVTNENCFFVVSTK